MKRSQFEEKYLKSKISYCIKCKGENHVYFDCEWLKENHELIWPSEFKNRPKSVAIAYLDESSSDENDEYS